MVIHDGSWLTSYPNSNFNISKIVSTNSNINLILVVDKPAVVTEDDKQDMLATDSLNKINEELNKNHLEFTTHQTQKETTNHLIFSTIIYNHNPLITIKNIMANNSIKIHDLKQIAKHLNVEKILFGTIQNIEFEFSQLSKLLIDSQVDFLRNHGVCKNSLTIIFEEQTDQGSTTDSIILPPEILAKIGSYVDGKIALCQTYNQSF